MRFGIFLQCLPQITRKFFVQDELQTVGHSVTIPVFYTVVALEAVRRTLLQMRCEALIGHVPTAAIEINDDLVEIQTEPRHVCIERFSRSR